MNTPESPDSPVTNTPGSGLPLNIGKQIPSVQNDSPVMNTPVSRHLGVLRTSTRTGLQKNFLVTNSSGVETPQSILHSGVFLTDVFCPETTSDF
jgi:hypothetical protein